MHYGVEIYLIGNLRVFMIPVVFRVFPVPLQRIRQSFPARPGSSVFFVRPASASCIKVKPFSLEEETTYIRFAPETFQQCAKTEFILLSRL